jgi:predicted DNA-binding antitoxin AbrB/MazE fold protein
MSRTITVVFDGEVFRPVEPVELESGQQYQVTIADLEPSDEAATGPKVNQRIIEQATDLGMPADLAAQPAPLMKYLDMGATEPTARPRGPARPLPARDAETQRVMLGPFRISFPLPAVGLPVSIGVEGRSWRR